MDGGILFRTSKLGKQYNGNVALRDIDLEVCRGEIVGLIGENGAGKSTLLRIISCVEQPTSGGMEMHGKRFDCRNPLEANSAGVGMVFQEQSLIKNLTVGHNIFLGKENRYRKLGFIDWRRMNEDARKALRAIGMEGISPERKAMELNFAARQMVEIARVLNMVEDTHGGCLILLDEPTSVLSDAEIRKLFAEMRRIRDQGNSIVFVSHRLSEVIEISDRIYVFKDGERTAIVPKENAKEDFLYEKMVGRSTSGQYFKVDQQTVPGKEVILEVHNLGLRGYFKGVGFQIRKGEVLGVCGVVGSGKEELCAVVCGDERPDEGSIAVEGAFRRFSSPLQAMNAGILEIPKERREEGIIGMLSVAENISLSSMKSISRHGIISNRKKLSRAEEWIRTLDIRTSGAMAAAESLSGGNAQKVVFARAISRGNSVLVMNHPTRGVDVGAKEEIYLLIRELTAKGIGIILLGDTLDECIGLSARIIVMKDGIVTAEFECPPDGKPSQVDVLRYMM